MMVMQREAARRKMSEDKKTGGHGEQEELFRVVLREHVRNLGE